MKGKNMITGENLTKIYNISDTEILALNNLNFNIDKGEIISIAGHSGSGKSTLLNLIGGLEKQSFGQLIVNDEDMKILDEKQLVEFKRSTVGFVWQNNARNLIPYLTAIENVEVPMLLRGKLNKDWALELLSRVGLNDKKNNRLNQLSGGEQQRVAIAIALANNPQILLADEPTGSVDSKTSDLIYQVLKDINNAYNTTIVIVTHDMILAKKAERIIYLEDGKLKEI